MASIPYIKPPSSESIYDVGDVVEVICDHEKDEQRIKGWLKGTVVQVDSKMVAVQFQINVYLTDGWMVPDHILWYPIHSSNIKPLKRCSSKRSVEATG